MHAILMHVYTWSILDLIHFRFCLNFEIQIRAKRFLTYTFVWFFNNSREKFIFKGKIR